MKQSRTAWAGGVPAWMDDSVLPAVQARALHGALSRGQVPAGALYATPFQAMRWLALHEAWSPARRDDGVQAAYDEVFGVLSHKLGDGPWTLASLGCGGGQKEERFLRGARRMPESALVVDISPGLALTSHARVSPFCEAHAGVIDLELNPVPSPWCESLLLGRQDQGRLPRVVFLLGMLPNMDLAHAARLLSSWTVRGDWIVLSANLASRDECALGLPGVIPQYDNPETRAWLSGFLEWQGIPAGGFEWSFGVEPEPALGGGGARITVDAVMHARALLAVPGHEPVAWEAGRRARVFQSLRMTREAALGFGREAGLECVHGASDGGSREGVFLLRR